MERNDCPPPIQISKNYINTLPNNNYINFEQDEENNFYQAINKSNKIYENIKISIGITLSELEKLNKENLIQLIHLINYSCNLTLKDIKYIYNYYNIFEIKENLNKNGYSIILSKNGNNEVNDKFKNINYIKESNINFTKNNFNLENNEKFYNKIINENDDNFSLLNDINQVYHNYCLPISCPNHNNIKFNNLSSYLIHCKESHKILTCKDCGKVFEDFNNFNFI